MVEIKYIFTQEAYCKAVFHANKYLSQQVCGLVIGQGNTKQSKSDAKQKEEQTTDFKQFKTIDCIPLSHGHILAPFLEAALTEVIIFHAILNMHLKC